MEKGCLKGMHWGAKAQLNSIIDDDEIYACFEHDMTELCVVSRCIFLNHIEAPRQPKRVTRCNLNTRPSFAPWHMLVQAFLVINRHHLLLAFRQAKKNEHQPYGSLAFPGGNVTCDRMRPDGDRQRLHLRQSLKQKTGYMYASHRMLFSSLAFMIGA